MVLFIVYHLNEALSLDAPLRLDVIMANTRWNVVQMAIKKNDPSLLNRIAIKEAKQVATESKEWAIMRMRERNKAVANVKRLMPLVRDGYVLKM